MASLKQKKYKIPFSLSVALHIVLFSLLVFSFSSTVKPMTMSATPKVRVIKAVSIDQTQVLQQMQQITAAKQKREQAAVAKQKKLQQQLKKAESQRRAQQRKLNKVLAQKRAADRKMKQQQLAAKRELARIKKQTQVAKQKQLALAKKQAATAASVKALQAQRKKEQAAITAAKKKKAQKAAKAEQARQAAAKKKQQQIAAAKAAEALKQKQAQEAAANARNQRILARYQQLILQDIERNWNIPQGIDPALSCEFQIKLAANGSVISVKLIRSSGNAALDRSARTAIYKASPLPMPEEKQVSKQFQDFYLNVSPQGII